MQDELENEEKDSGFRLEENIGDIRRIRNVSFPSFLDAKCDNFTFVLEIRKSILGKIRY